MIFAVNQENIGITGKGTINGRGFITANNMVNYIHRGVYADPLKYDRPNETNRPQNIYFRECKTSSLRISPCAIQRAGTRPMINVKMYM